MAQHLPNIAPSPDEHNPYGRVASAQPSATMRNNTTSKATELRWKAAQWRKHDATGSSDFIELMQRAAAELESEADRLEGHSPLVGQRDHELLAS
jgi:hypothetical protein